MNWLKEPLLHFLLIGSALFGLYYLSNPSALKSDHLITVDTNTINHLSTAFQRNWNRAPTQQELEALVNDYIVEEIFYRQALALGLDQNDALIRRRLKQKMELLVSSSADQLQPSDQALEAFLEQHPEKFELEPRISFKQIYVRTDRSRVQIEAQLETIQAALAKGDAVMGSSTLLPTQMDDASTREIDRVFGSGFAQQLQKLPTERWSDPIQSGLGLHFIKVTRVQASELPDLASIRPQVEREWLRVQEEKIKAQLRENLLADYQVKVEWPQQATTKTSL